MPVESNKFNDTVLGYCICDENDFNVELTIPERDIKMLFQSEMQAEIFLKDFIDGI